MRRFTWAILAMLTLATAVAQFKNNVPFNVQAYLTERAEVQRLTQEDKTQALKQMSPQFAPPRRINGIEMVSAFIDIDNKSTIAVLKAHGVRVNSVFDGFVTAHIPVDKLSEISMLDGVADIEIGRKMELCTDSTLSKTLAGQVLNGTEYGLPQAYDGTGVVIGIIDSGFDFQHYAFRSEEDPSRSRIVRVYNPEDTTGHPIIVDSNHSWGSVFMDEQIDTLTTDKAGNTHGTHTASIAAGRHFNGWGGMAPGADIVLCASWSLNVSLYEPEVIDCVNYIYSYADSVGKPCVISVSVSTNEGPHDGNDRVSKAIAQMVGPGHIFVIAAGNNGVRQAYCSGQTQAKTPFSMLLGCKNLNINSDYSYYYGNIWVDSWVRETGLGNRPVAKFHILDKETKRIVWESGYINEDKSIYSTEFSDYFEPDLSVDSIGYVRAANYYNSNSKKWSMRTYVNNLRCKASSIDATGLITSRYQIGVSIYPISVLYPGTASNFTIDSWLAVSTAQRDWNDGIYIDKTSTDGSIETEFVPGFYALPSNDCSIGSYAVNDSVISVGAYIGRNWFYSLQLDSIMVDPNTTIGGYTNFSGFQSTGVGPTGSALPTVTAPGYNVIAAGSRYSYFSEFTPSLVARSDDGSYWGVLSGTSMATPAVAGIIAQWLQINPNLSPGDIKRIIAQTAIKDEFTSNPNFGVRFGPNGKIDAMAGARLLLGIEEPTTLAGDVDGNGKVNIDDITLLIDYMLGMDVDINQDAADVYPDNVINIDDLTTLIDYMLGIPFK